MNSKNLKVVDEHNIDRDASILFSFELDGSGYVSYSIDRDEENSNIFLSKVIRNLDGTFNMLDIDDSSEKTRLNGIIKNVITASVDSQDDKLNGNTLSLNDGKVIKFITVNFNKEQRINVQKTYVTTVKKEVVRVVENYYVLPTVVETPVTVEEIFPSVTPVVEPVKDIEPTVVEPITVPTPEPVIPAPVVEPAVVVPTPVVEAPKVDGPSTPVIEPQVVSPIVEPASIVPSEPVVQTAVVEPVPELAVVDSQPLVFNATKETNLNAALGEVANSSTIPVENIEPIREFGVDAPVSQPAAVVVNPTVQPVGATNPVMPGDINGSPSVKKGGFANSKFFMVVAIAFFLASCVFLGYEVFAYFQLTK